MLRLLWNRIKTSRLYDHLDPLPLANALPSLSRQTLRADLRAALSVAFLGIPQGMAYAMLAGLPIQSGIVCGALASIVSPLWAGSRHTVLGPTNATAFLAFSALALNVVGRPAEAMPLVVFLAGILLILGAYLRFADLIQYVSRSVVVGYVTGAAVLIILNQLKYVLGVALPAEESQTFVGVSLGLLSRLREVHWESLSVGVATVAAYFGCRRWCKELTFPATLIGVTFLTVAGQNLLKLHIDDFSQQRFLLTDLLPHAPQFASVGIFDRIGALFGVALGVAFLAALETSVMSKTLAGRTGDRPNLNQDMLSLGITNLFTASFSGMPASGSLTRSALNLAAGAKTRFASIFSGLFCLMGTLAFGGALARVPKACLAALIICVAITLINKKHLRICLNATKSDAAVLITTITASLLSRLDIAIFLGTATSIALYLKKASQPTLAEYEFTKDGQLAEAENPSQRKHPSISIVHVEGDLFFGAAELFRTQIQRISTDRSIKVIILRLKHARHLDATSVMALEDLLAFLRSTNRHLIISGASRDVFRVLENSGLARLLDEDPPAWRTPKLNRNIFLNDPHNPNISTRDALLRAQEVLGDEKAEIRIFYDPSKTQG